MMQADKARHLRALHLKGEPLILFNAWDCVTARILESAGSAAVATSSAGVCFAQGYRDGQHIGRDVMLAAVARIAAAVTIPVTADLEGGYGDDISAAQATALGALEAGVAGLNFEDRPVSGEGLLDAQLQAQRIAAIRAVGDAGGVPLVINARTDVFFGSGVPEAQQMAQTVQRAALYIEAGADCIFVPGVFSETRIAELVKNIGAPVNLLALPANPNPARMKDLGVARISYGSMPIQAAMGAFAASARSALDSSFEHGAARMDYDSLNALFAERR